MTSLILDLLELSDDLDLLDFVDSDGNLVDSDNLERYLSRLQSLVAQTEEAEIEADSAEIEAEIDLSRLGGR